MNTKSWKRFLFPPVWLLLLLLLFSMSGLVFVFLRGFSEHPAAAVVYAIAFYTLCIVCAYAVMTLPGQYRKIRERIHAHPLGRRYMTDAGFKTQVSLHTSLLVNLLYVGLNVLAWYFYRSLWFLLLAGYYAILAVMRFLLLQYTHHNPLGKKRLEELKRARLCSFVLLTVNFALSGTVMMILYQNRGFHYHGLFIYAMAAYTFYITTHAIVNLVRYRKYRSPVITTSKIVSLSAALVSMLALETAMFSQFGGDMKPENQWLMIVLTGAGVSITVVALSVGMIVKTAKEIKEINRNGREE